MLQHTPGTTQSFAPLSGSVGVPEILLAGVIRVDYFNDRLNNDRSLSVFAKNILLAY
jgi:hypothetical protein